MPCPIKDFSITDANGKQCFFYTEKTPSGTPRAVAFRNEAGHINKGYVWHKRIEFPTGTEEPLPAANLGAKSFRASLPAVCLSLRASRPQIQAAFSKGNR